VPKTETEPVLAESFERVNSEYFNGLIDKPNLVWCNGRSRLGFYDYGRDTIAISRVLEDRQRLIDYVMYHEMLHKKHKFNTKGRIRHHSKDFRQDEKAFRDAELLEKELGRAAKSFWQRLF
jgi:predicted SprT family Zn-dependent metalloprotease